MTLSVREIRRDDIHLIVGYFVDSDAKYLHAMGADKNKLPKRSEWVKMLNLELDKPFREKQFYYIIWQVDERPVGHSNINKIEFGSTASMHLHIWNEQNRKKGLGLSFLQMTLPFYFKNFDLEWLICEPYAKNPAPNKILPKLGFEFVKEYETIPGWINFKQPVKTYKIDKEVFEKLWTVKKVDIK